MNFHQIGSCPRSSILLEAAKKAQKNRGTKARSRGPAQSRKQYAAEVRMLKIKTVEGLGTI